MVWRLCTTLDVVAGDRAHAARAEHAAQVMAQFFEPAALEALAERALTAIEDKDGARGKLLVRAGRRGVRALYQARLKQGTFEAREHFVALAKATGPTGSPVIRMALEHLLPRLAMPGASYLAEDLIKATAESPDEELGQLLVRYARSEHVHVVIAATEALPRALGRRARAPLRALLQHQDESVFVTALRCLRRVSGVDEEILQDLRPFVLGTIGSRPAMRKAAIDALAATTAAALPIARTLAEEAFAAARGTTADVEEMAVALANAIVAIRADASIIASRWRETQSPTLRAQLEAILRRAAPH